MATNIALQEFAILGKDFLYSIEVREDLLHADDARIGFRVEPLHILTKESVEDGVLAAVPGMHHGAAVSGAPPDRCGRGRFPPLLDDQLSCGVQQAAVRQLHSFRLGEPAYGDGTVAFYTLDNYVSCSSSNISQESMVALANTRIPRVIDEVTAEWLCEALRAGHRSLKPLIINTIRIEQIAQDSGFSSLLYRIDLMGDPGVPLTVIVKLAAQSEARWAMEMLSGYRRELCFINVSRAKPR